VDIVPLPEDRWKEYREIRLSALRAEPAAFGSSHEEEEALTEDDWRKRMGSVLFAMDGGAPVGMIGYAVNTRLKTRHIAHIYGVYVRAERRGEGIGRKLLEAAIDRIGENQGVVKIQLSVNPDMRTAVAMYEGAGFVSEMRARRELFVDGRYHDLLYMEKQIR